MGLFDWLTDGVGSDILGGGTPTQPAADPTMLGQNPMGDPTGGRVPMPPAAPGPSGPMPMPQMTGTDAPPLAPPPAPPPAPPYGQGTDPMTAGGPTPNGPGLPPPPAPPANANAAMAPPPLPATPPPGPPMSLAPPGNGTNGVGPGLGVATPDKLANSTPLARALGLNPNQAKEAASGFGAGLTAAGNSRGKSKFQAFSSGAGAAVEGADKRSDKTEDKQSKYLTQAIAAANAGDTRALNQARAKLALAQAEQAMAKGGGKDSVVNSEQQLYLRAQSAAAQDGRLKALKTQADQAASAYGPNDPRTKAAVQAHKDAYDTTVQGHLASLGLDPDKAKSIAKQPGMSSDNPLKIKTNDDLAKAQPGQIVQLPDGTVMRKKMDAAPGATPAAAGGGTPAVEPTPVTAPAGSKADKDEDED